MEEDRDFGELYRWELRTIFFVLAVLMLSESCLRAFEGQLSGNVAHINEIPKLAAEYSSASDNSLLFLGNSLTNNSIDLSLASDLLTGQGLEFGPSNKFVPDGTTIWSWSCLMRNLFFAQETAPDLVVIGFGWNQLSDQSRVLPTPLGAFFCSIPDLAYIGNRMPVTSAEVGEFLTAYFLRTFAHRQTIRNRLLTVAIPNYQSMTQESNRRTVDEEGASADLNFTYEVLGDLIREVKARSSNLVVVALPVRDRPYEIDKELTGLLQSSDVPLFDYRHLSDIGEGSFIDSMHLNSQGAETLTARLVTDLSRTLTLPD